jgi:hypothetical protein
MTSSWVMCADDFLRLVTVDVRKMSEKEKAEFRRGWIEAYPIEFRKTFADYPEGRDRA